MTLNEYFKLADSPSKNSPVGRLMEQILQESPEMEYEQAREKAKECLLKAAGRMTYRAFTPKQDEVNKARARKHFAGS